ncbi:M17 family metallopeptidase, partial [Nocardioides sp.]|uniref:leucyl aminopeptidase family protein n=1 Tax=Nocardioides sp. TaxID=35761 RepID=UPI0027370421
MNIQLVQKVKNSSAPVFFLKNKAKAKEHDFLKLLPKEDRDYFVRFLDKNGSTNSPQGGDEDFLRPLLLPSGRKAVIVLEKENKKSPLRKTIISMRRIISMARKEKIKDVAVNLGDFLVAGSKEDDMAELMATQFELANFEFNAYKTVPKAGWNFIHEAQVYADLTRTNADKIKRALQNGKIIGEEINKARFLSNTPGGDMTPARLAEAATKAGKTSGFKVKVLNEAQIKKLGMGGVIGVSKGSAERPRFIIMEYMKGKKSEKPVVLIGKGVTFDTGGLNLKPSQHIYEMHMDMSGGAAVIHTIAALARLKVKKNIIGLVPAVENMPSGSSYHPGDLLKTMNGKTIEVLDTDAEGRVILADALEYSKKYNPELVIDIATLTGAAMAALGQRASAIFSTDLKIENELREAGEKTGDYVWPLPLWEEYEEEIKGTFGDFANVGKTRYGGAITGAVFLWQFIKSDPPSLKLRRASKQKEIPWVHLDIAPRMTTIESDSLAKGAAGASIALLT